MWTAAMGSDEQVKGNYILIVCVCFLKKFLYKFCIIPGVYTRVKPPSHVTNIKAAQNKE